MNNLLLKYFLNGFHYETENYQSENPKTEHGILRISKTEKIFSQNFF